MNFIKNNKKVILIGAVVLVAIVGYFLGQRSNEPSDPDLKQLKQEYETAVKSGEVAPIGQEDAQTQATEKQTTETQAVTQNSTQDNNKKATEVGLFPKQGQKFYDSALGKAVDALFKEVSKGVVYNNGSVTYSKNLQDTLFIKNSPRHTSANDGWLYARGLEEFAKKLNSNGANVEMVGYPLADNMSLVNSGAMTNGTVLFRQIQTNTYWIGKYNIFIFKQDGHSGVSESDFSLELTPVSNSELAQVRSTYIKG